MWCTGGGGSGSRAGHTSAGGGGGSDDPNDASDEEGSDSGGYAAGGDWSPPGGGSGGDDDDWNRCVQLAMVRALRFRPWSMQKCVSRCHTMSSDVRIWLTGAISAPVFNVFGPMGHLLWVLL